MAKNKEQKAKGKRQEAKLSTRQILPLAFCPLPFAPCFLPFAFCPLFHFMVAHPILMRSAEQIDYKLQGLVIVLKVCVA